MIRRAALGKVIISLLTTFIGMTATPLTSSVETNLGLDWLFKLRGPRPAPADVIVVSIDQQSATQLGLSNAALPLNWPRSLHARLVNTLASQGAQVIAFDIHFDESRNSDDDLQFAAALGKAGNVVLVDYLKPLPSDRKQAIIEQRAPPIPRFAEQAAATAPFPLPTRPIRVNQCWLFKSEAGDTPTLPAVAFQIYAQQFGGEWLSRIATSAPADPNPAQFARALHELFQANPDVKQNLLVALQSSSPALSDPRAHSVLTALLDLYSGPDTRYLDLYGPPRSITTIPYYQLVEDSPSTGEQALLSSIRGKAVFVGFSEQLQSEQKDGFYTVFSQPNGLDISGVEIAATAFANLLENRFVKPLDLLFQLLLIALWGTALGLLLMVLPAFMLVPAAVTLAVAYTGLAYQVFARDALWLPLVVPLLLQLPFALVGTLFWRYWYSHKERQKLRDVFGHYLPAQIVDELTRHGAALPAAQQQSVYGICLDTDAAQYTQFSERLPPYQLHILLNSYYEVLFAPVRRRGGFISDVIGDAMLAVWATPAPSLALREQACSAALDIISAVNDLNHRVPEAYLPTRIGLHCGEMLLCNVGAGDHYEYRAVGDIVNTTNRIQGLNKLLGTRVLVSEEVIKDLGLFATREVGAFRLTGKSKPLVIYELVCTADQLNPLVRSLHARFAAGLAAFRAQRWQDAYEIFHQSLATYHDDGPSRYYLQLCEQFKGESYREHWDSAVNIRRAAEADLGRRRPRNTGVDKQATGDWQPSQRKETALPADADLSASKAASPMTLLQKD